MAQLDRVALALPSSLPSSSSSPSPSNGSARMGAAAATAATTATAATAATVGSRTDRSSGGRAQEVEAETAVTDTDDGVFPNEIQDLMLQVLAVPKLTSMTRVTEREWYNHTCTHIRTYTYKPRTRTNHTRARSLVLSSFCPCAHESFFSHTFLSLFLPPPPPPLLFICAPVFSFHRSFSLSFTSSLPLLSPFVSLSGWSTVVHVGTKSVG
jgi:hypothetical protein